MLRFAATAFVVLATVALTSSAFDQTAPQPKRTVLKTADLTGTDKEIIIAEFEVPPGAFVPRHIHPGEEATYVLEGARMQMPDGTEIDRPVGQAGVNVREVPHAGYKIVGDKTLKILTIHIVDKGKPMTVPVP